MSTMPTSADDFAVVPREVEDDLDSFLAEPISEEQLAEVPPPVDDPVRANRYLRRIRRLEENAAQVDSLASDEIARIREWADQRKASIEREQNWLARSLEAFARNNATATGSKTVKLPNGDLSLRAPRVRVEIDDEDALLGSVDESLYRVTYKADRTALAKLDPGTWSPTEDEVDVEEAPVVSPVGEILPGVRFVRSTTDTFTWRTK